MILMSFIAVLVLVATHIFVNKMRLSYLPRSRWLSIAGGISVAYIFLEAFPELNEIQKHVSESEIIGFQQIAEMEVYLLSLLGLTFFYGLENRSKKSKESNRDPNMGKKKNLDIFWIHVSSFALYNFIIGYLLLHREDSSVQSLSLYTIAMAFHFMVTDHALYDHFGHSYKRSGRWLLVFAIFSGWVLSVFVEIPEVYIGLIFSFLAGGVIMNVLKEELPKERDSNLLAFCLGILAYSVILLLI